MSLRPLGGQRVVGLALNPESSVLSTDSKLPHPRRIPPFISVGVGGGGKHGEARDSVLVTLGLHS